MLSILISSTFNDMQAERDVIRTRVEPALRKVAAQYGQSVRLLDLRWGVNTANMSEEEASQKVLDVCLDEIDRCDGYMVCLLGNRYGWVPDYSKVDSVQRHGVLMEEPVSVTELEIQYGLLQRNQGERAIVFFRDEVCDLPEELYDQYNDPAKDLRQSILKEKLEQLNYTNCTHYRLNSLPDGEFGGLDLFAQMLLEQLTKLIQRIFSNEAAYTSVQQQTKKFESIMDEAYDGYLPVPELENALRDFRQSTADYMVISGAQGMGKSAFAARLYQEPPAGVRIIPYFCGMDVHKTEPVHILRYFAGVLNEKNYCETAALDEAKEQLTESLCKIEEPVWFVIDGLEQIDGKGEALISWLPQNLPSHVRILITASIEEKSWQQLEEFHQVQSVKIPPLKNAEEFMNRQLASRGKEIPKELLKKVAKHRLSGSYFFCDMVMRMLLLINRNDFLLMRQAGDGIDSINGYIRRKLENLPKTFEEMTFLFLFDCGAQIMSGNAGDYIAAIACSPIGLRAQDLQSIFPEHWDEPEFAFFTEFLEGYLVEDENGCYRLRAGIVQQAGLKAADEEILRKVAEYLRTLPDEDPVKQASATFLFLYLNWMEDIKRLILKNPQHPMIKEDIIKTIVSHRSLIAKLLKDDEMLKWFLEFIIPALGDRLSMVNTAEILEERHTPKDVELRIRWKQNLADLYERCMEERKAFAVRKDLLSLYHDPVEAAKLRIVLVGSAFVENKEEAREIEAMLTEALLILEKNEPCLHRYYGEFYQTLFCLQEEFGFNVSGMRRLSDVINLQDHARSKASYVETILFGGLRYFGKMERKVTMQMTNLLMRMCEQGNEMLDLLEKRAEQAEQYGELLLLMLRALNRADSYKEPLWGEFENEIAKAQLEIFRKYRLVFGKRVCYVLAENMKDGSQTYANKMLAKLRILHADFVDTLEERTELLRKGCRVLRRYFSQEPLSEYAEELATALLSLAECYQAQDNEKAYENTLEEWGIVVLGTSKYHMTKALEECRKYPDEIHQESLELARTKLECYWEEYAERLLLGKDYVVHSTIESIFALVYLARSEGREYIPEIHYARDIYKELELLQCIERYAKDPSLDSLKKQCLPQVDRALRHTINRLLLLLERKLDVNAEKSICRPEGYYPLAIGFTEKYIAKLNEKDVMERVPKEKLRLAFRLAQLQYRHGQYDPEIEEEMTKESLMLLETIRECMGEETSCQENWMYEELSIQNVRYWMLKETMLLGDFNYDRMQFLVAVKYYKQALDLCLLLKGVYSENPSKEAVTREYGIRMIPRLHQCIEKTELWSEAEEIAKKASVLL